MPSEKRLIIFDHDEIIAALGAADRMASEKFLAGHIVSCEVVDKAKLNVTTNHSGPDGPTETAQTIPDDILNDALIRFCMENNIMLSKSAQKSIRYLENSVALFQVIGNPELAEL